MLKGEYRKKQLFITSGELGLQPCRLPIKPHFILYLIQMFGISGGPLEGDTLRHFESMFSMINDEFIMYLIIKIKFLSREEGNPCRVGRSLNKIRPHGL